MPGTWPSCDEVLLAGVGTILTQELPKTPKIVVFGSGAGYGSLPDDINEPWCHCYGFRGPLTTALCGFDEDRILADPAILIPDLLPAPELPEDEKKVIFVPHVHSAKRVDWETICKDADLGLVDPRGESKEVILKIASAKLVLAESMHAAIIADAYRVPWIPVWSTREISKFKWVDWALSVGAEVNPIILSPPSRIAWLDDKFAELASNENSTLNGADFEANNVDQKAMVAHLAEINARRSTKKAKSNRTNYLRVRDRICRPIINIIGNTPRSMQLNTANQLKNAATQKSYLSNDSQFEQAKDRLRKAIEQLKADRKDSFAKLSTRPA